MESLIWILTIASLILIMSGWGDTFFEKIDISKKHGIIWLILYLLCSYIEIPLWGHEKASVDGCLLPLFSILLLFASLRSWLATIRILLLGVSLGFMCFLFITIMNQT